MIYEIKNLIDTMYKAKDCGVNLDLIATKNYGFEGEFYSYKFNLIDPKLINEIKTECWGVLNLWNKLNVELEAIEKEHHTEECKKAFDEWNFETPEYVCNCKVPTKEELKEELYKKHVETIKKRLEEWEKQN